MSLRMLYLILLIIYSFYIFSKNSSIQEKYYSILFSKVNQLSNNYYLNLLKIKHISDYLTITYDV